ncbi:MAG TPA: S-layer homology domain-containing protein [Thermoanaerobaculia bacterium]|nr:S-layer homology domain-containing protein [Thermoanaerobaculia bacterium]
MGLLFLHAVLAQAGTAVSPNPSVTFTSPGVKQVTLEVCNDAGCDTETREVVVHDPLPQIVGVGSVPSVVGTQQTLTFSGQATGRPSLTYRWVLSTGNKLSAITGNPAAWSPQTADIGTYQGYLEVQNTDGTASSVATPFSFSVVRMTFNDVPPTHWAWRYVEGIYTQGLTAGCAANPMRYCPSLPVSRAETAVFMVRASHETGFVPPMPTGIFNDVAVGFWAAPWIEQMFVDGLTGGCALAPLRYCPGDSVTRAEIAVFLLKLKHGPAYLPPPATGTVFSDVSASYWAAPWIEQLYAEGLTGGCGMNPLRYCPTDSVKRDQMATFLSRVLDLTFP